MSEIDIYRVAVHAYPAVAACVAIALLFITAPYGRHNAKGSWGLQIGNRNGWLLMEIPASLAPLVLYVIGDHKDIVTWAFMFLWQLHYALRAFVFPFRRRGGVATMPLSVSLLGLLFNFINAYLIWRFLTYLGPRYDPSWLTSLPFLGGALLFLVGFAINQHADWVLLNLRKPGETGYKIPYGGLYGLVSCPNYLGEILEWTGFAICTWMLAGLGFALWTAANLVPRALAHHRDYRSRFRNYPSERCAVIPFLL